MRRIHFASALLVPLLACAAMLVQGCAGTRAAYKEADTLDEYAYVVTENYAALVKQAADLAALPTTPAAAKAAMRAGDNAVAPLILGEKSEDASVPGLQQLAANYKQIRSASNEADLQRAVDAAVLKLADLVRAIKAAGGK